MLSLANGLQLLWESLLFYGLLENKEERKQT